MGAKLGRALVTPGFARLFRPTGFTGPLAGAAAGSRLLGLSEAACASALALAANTVSGLNQWPHSGGAEMFFHPGFAARAPHLSRPALPHSHHAHHLQHRPLLLQARNHGNVTLWWS